MRSDCISFNYGALLLGTLLLIGGCAQIESARMVQSFPKQPEASMQSSTDLEGKGDISAAVEELKIALTLDPDNQKAKQQLARLIEKRNKLAEEHYQAGMKMKQTDLQGAKREFLAALRVRTDFQEAMLELKNLQLESSEATLQVRAKREAQLAARTQERSQIATEEDVEETSFDRAVSLFEDGDYAAAAHEFQKAKSHAPNDPEIHRYLNLCYYDLGLAQFKKKDYKKALDSFAKVKKGFEGVDDYVKRCRSGLRHQAEDLYKLGLKFFREQNLQEAIIRWNGVLEIEPEHHKAKEYIEKAKKLQNALKKQS